MMLTFSESLPRISKNTFPNQHTGNRKSLTEAKKAFSPRKNIVEIMLFPPCFHKKKAIKYGMITIASLSFAK